MTTTGELRAIADPVERARAIRTAQAEHRRVATELGELLRDTVAELRAGGASHAQIAEMLGVTRARAQQLAAGAGQ